MRRGVWVWLHRWLGLALAGFLVVVGLTGSLIAFYPEIDQLFNPRIYELKPGQPLPPGELAARTETATGLRVTSVSAYRDNQAPWVGVQAASGKPEPTYEYLRLEPVTGEEIWRENWGEISEGIENFMPFIYTLHYALALDEFGMWVLGIAALVWTLDSFIGFYLTLPPRRRTLQARPENNVWQRWWPAWKIRWLASRYKLNFDLHRAGGLWLWGMLLVFAWSSVYMNLSDTVYTWVTRAFMEYRTSDDVPVRAQAVAKPRLDWRAAQSRADELMAQVARKHEFAVIQPMGIRFDTQRGVYEYRVRSSRDILDRGGYTRLSFDADTGELRQLLLPTGQYAGNTVTSWLVALHEGNVFGLPYRIFVCVFGVCVAILSITGVIIWWKKRQARRHARDVRRVAQFGPECRA